MSSITPTAGPVAGAIVPSAVWTVDSATGKVETTGNPPGSPSGSEMRRAADSLMRGVPAPSLGELDLAERGVMQLRTATMPRAFGGLLGLVLLFLAFRYGLGGLVGLFVLPELLNGKVSGALALSFASDVLLLVGIVLGAALVFNFRNAAMLSMDRLGAPGGRGCWRAGRRRRCLNLPADGRHRLAESEDCWPDRLWRSA